MCQLAGDGWSAGLDSALAKEVGCVESGGTTCHPFLLKHWNHLKPNVQAASHSTKHDGGLLLAHLAEGPFPEESIIFNMFLLYLPKATACLFIRTTCVNMWKYMLYESTSNIFQICMKIHRYLHKNSHLTLQLLGSRWSTLLLALQVAHVHLHTSLPMQISTCNTRSRILLMRPFRSIEILSILKTTISVYVSRCLCLYLYLYLSIKNP